MTIMAGSPGPVIQDERITMIDHTHRSDVAFLFPGILVYAMFLIVPLSLSFIYSFTNWNGLSPDLRFTGIRNFLLLVREPMFLESLKVTLLITVFTTAGVNIVGIVTAAVLNRDGRLFKLGRTLVFVPAILSPVVVSFMWAHMTQTNGGIINRVLSFINLPPIDLYASTGRIVGMVSGVIAWAALGFYVTIYIANMKSIPGELYEAADIDGAGPYRKFRSITVPMLRPAIIINTMTAMIWGLKQYDFVKVMVPSHIQTVTIYAVERAFEYNMFGYSSAVVMILLIMTLVVSIVQMKIIRKGSDIDS